MIQLISTRHSIRFKRSYYSVSNRLAALRFFNVFNRLISITKFNNWWWATKIECLYSFLEFSFIKILFLLALYLLLGIIKIKPNLGCLTNTFTKIFLYHLKGVRPFLTPFLTLLFLKNSHPCNRVKNISFSSFALKNWYNKVNMHHMQFQVDLRIKLKIISAYNYKKNITLA